MATIGNPIGFLDTSATPIVGSLANFFEPNCLKQAQITTDTQLVAGDPLVVLVSQANAQKGEIDGLNPQNQSITAKATTNATSGANTTNVCGFMIINSNDKVTTGGVGVPSKGQICLYAPLGQGAVIWLEVAQQNLTAFNKNLDTNTQITIDSTNGGVKVGSGADVLEGAKVIQGVTNAQKISVTSGTPKLVPCKAILVQLS